MAGLGLVGPYGLVAKFKPHYHHFLVYFTQSVYWFFPLISEFQMIEKRFKTKYFRSNTTDTNYFTTFLQTTDVTLVFSK